MRKKGNITLIVLFLLITMTTIIISALIAPVGTTFITHAFVAGEEIWLKNNETIQSIQNTTIRADIEAMYANAVLSTQDNIEIGTNLYKYGWVLIVGLFALIMFMYARQIVEVRSYGGGLV